VIHFLSPDFTTRRAARLGVAGPTEVRSPPAFFVDSMLWPPLLPRMLTKPRTVCFCQPVVSIISASVTPFARFIIAITSAFLLLRSAAGLPFEEDSRNEHTIVGRCHSDLRIHGPITRTSSTSEAAARSRTQEVGVFLGKWTAESEIKANGYVPAGKGVTTETCTLGPGGFYVEHRAEGQIPNTFGIIAYDSYAKAYTTFYASSAGLVGTGIGSVKGNTWTWMVEDRFAGKAVKGRTTITTLSPTEYTSKYEMADEKGGYTTILEGKATKETR
jgi:Protein of unknown function (DUF1579)